jgi:hypothetical protein
MNPGKYWLKLIPVGLMLLASTALAQTGKGDVVYVPTPQVVVDEMLKMAKVGPKDYLIDLGSGDGRIVITAAKRLGAQGFGVDLDQYLLKIANANAAKEGVTDRARFVEQNLFETDLSPATVISSYLLPEMNRKLRPKLLGLKPGTRIVAHDYSMGQWTADEEKNADRPGKDRGRSGKELRLPLYRPGERGWHVGVADPDRRSGRAVRLQFRSGVSGRDRPAARRRKRHQPAPIQGERRRSHLQRHGDHRRQARRSHVSGAG